jgi:hypothetical protein
VRSNTAVNLLVDVEVYGPTGTRVCQQFFDGQALTAGQTRSYTVTCTVPAGAPTGSYTIKLGLFTPGWGRLLDWNNGAGQFTVTP